MPEPEKKIKKSPRWQPWSPEYIGLFPGNLPRPQQNGAYNVQGGHPLRWLGMYPDTEFKVYLIRLNEYLELQKGVGAVTQSQIDQVWSDLGQTISEGWKEISPWFTLKQDAKYPPGKEGEDEWNLDFTAMTDKIGLTTPFWNETALNDFEWQSKVNKLRKEAIQTGYKLQAERGDYLPRLQNALNAAKSRGAMTYAETKSAYAEAEEAINAGVAGKNLPYAKQVEAWEAFKESEVKRTAQETEEGQRKMGPRTIGQDEGELEAQRQAEWRKEYTGNAWQFEQAKEQALEETRNQPIDWIRRWQLQHMGGAYDVPGARTIFTQAGLYREPEQTIAPRIGIPDIVRRFAPGVRATGNIMQPLSAEGITTPSGQALGRMLPSEAETLQGYAAYSGQYWPDILARTAKMLPQPLRGSAWRSTRQGG